MRLGALMTFLNPGLDTAAESAPHADAGSDRNSKITLSPAEWRKRLTPDQFHVLRERGSSRRLRTEHPRADATDRCACAGCGAELFAVGDALSGSRELRQFASPIDDHALYESLDSRHGLLRVAISCSRCDGHLGYVELDPAIPSGKRYLVESIAMTSRKEN